MGMVMPPREVGRDGRILTQKLEQTLERAVVARQLARQVVPHLPAHLQVDLLGPTVIHKYAQVRVPATWRQGR